MLHEVSIERKYPNLMLSDKFRVVAALNPFKLTTIEKKYRVGTSLIDILHDLKVSKDVHARIFLNGELVLNRELVKPRRGDLLTIRITLGQGGGSNIQSLAIQVGAMVLGAVLAIPTGGLSMVAAGAAIGGALGSLVGGVVSMLTAPKQPDQNLTSYPQQSTIRGDNNSLAPYAPVPFIGGMRKTSPMYAVTSFEEAHSQKQFVVLLLSLGYGPLDISLTKIANTLITNYEDIQVQFRAGYPDDQPQTLFKSIPHEDDFNLVLLDSTSNNVTPAPAQIKTTPVGATSIACDFQFPNGLSTTNNVGNTRWLKVKIQIQYALTGTPHPIVMGVEQNWLSRPVLSIGGASTRAKIATDTWDVAPGQYDVKCQVLRVVVQPGAGIGSGNLISADTNWVALRTFEAGIPVVLPNQALIAMRIRATGQLNGTISNLTAYACSIFRTYIDADAEQPDPWATRAGSWYYDYILGGNGAGGGGSSAPVYVANVIDITPPGAPIVFSDDLQTYIPQTAAGALLQAAGVTNSGGDLYYDGTTVIATAFTNPAVILVWTAANGWTTPLVLTDGNSYLGFNGAGNQPQTGPSAIDFDAAVYAIGGQDLNGSTAVWYATNPSAGPWTKVNLDNNIGFDGVLRMKWIARLNLWIAVGEQIWSAPSGAATWTSRYGFFNDPTGNYIGEVDFFFALYDDGTTLWVFGNGFIYSSTDGITWTQHAYPATFPVIGGNKNAPIFYDAVLSLWVGMSQGGSNTTGIYWTATPTGTWTLGYDASSSSDYIQSFAKVGSKLYGVGSRTLSTGPVSSTAIVANSTDDKTWTIVVSTLPETPSFDFSGIGSTIAAPDNSSLGLSLNNQNAAHPSTITYSTDGGATMVIEYNSGQFDKIIKG